MARVGSNVFTPKALHSKAQGQRRSRATLGTWNKIRIYPEGVIPDELCNSFGVKYLSIAHPECASRLWALEFNRFAVKNSKAVLITQHCAVFAGFRGSLQGSVFPIDQDALVAPETAGGFDDLMAPVS